MTAKILTLPKRDNKTIETEYREGFTVEDILMEVATLDLDNCLVIGQKGTDLYIDCTASAESTDARELISRALDVLNKAGC